MSEQKQTDIGGRVFPLQDNTIDGSEGITLLDYFAGQALMGNATAGIEGTDVAHVAGMCYEQAAAMIAEKRRRELPR